MFYANLAGSPYVHQSHFNLQFQTKRVSLWEIPAVLLHFSRAGVTFVGNPFKFRGEPLPWNPMHVIDIMIVLE